MSGAAGGGAPSCGGAAGPCAPGAVGGGGGIAGRLPSRVLEHIFSYLELPELIRCSLVCWHWNRCLSDENSEVWRTLCGRTLSEEALRSDILCNIPTYKGKVPAPPSPAPRCLKPLLGLRTALAGRRAVHNTALEVCSYGGFAGLG